MRTRITIILFLLIGICISANEPSSPAMYYPIHTDNTLAGLGTVEDPLRIDTTESVDRVATQFMLAELKAIIYSGIYTPTENDRTNLDAVTLTEAQYMRVGNTVTVSGEYSADLTNNTDLTSFTMDLPIASDINETFYVAGTSCDPFIVTNCARILGNTTNDRAKIEWVPNGAEVSTSIDWSYTFTYRIN